MRQGVQYLSTQSKLSFHFISNTVLVVSLQIEYLDYYELLMGMEAYKATV